MLAPYSSERFLSAIRMLRRRLASAGSVMESIYRRNLPVVVISVALLVVVIVAAVSAPPRFPSNTTVSIEEGAPLRTITHDLKNAHIVRYATLLHLLVTLSGDTHNVIAGDYLFEEPQAVFTVARRITRGEFDIKQVKVTVPEGASLVDIAGLFSEQLSMFDPEHFLELTKGKEGYLFPDTYLFFSNVKEDEVVALLADTFQEKISPLKGDMLVSGRTLDEIVTMASIVEEEAKTTESRRIIAGILWKRIDIGMPLQVDVTFDYINGKNTFELTTDDLAIDSPYNTYRYAGLPPTPIGNPSLDAIEAALYPIDSNYLYFLADRKGEVHYSTTFEEHKEKKRRYLN